MRLTTTIEEPPHENIYERRGMIEAVEQSQANQMNLVSDAMMDMMSIGASDSVYQFFRSKTTLGLEVSSLIAGGYGAVKGVISFSKLVRMPGQIAKTAKMSTKQLNNGNGFFGNKGFEFKNAKFQKVRNNPSTIQGRSYVPHALDQMQNRGFTPSIIEETIQKGVGTPNKVIGRMQFYDSINNISVIIEDGTVVFRIIFLNLCHLLVLNSQVSFEIVSENFLKSRE